MSRSRIACYVTIFQNISNLRDIFYKEMSKVSPPQIPPRFCWRRAARCWWCWGVTSAGASPPASPESCSSPGARRKKALLSIDSVVDK